MFIERIVVKIYKRKSIMFRNRKLTNWNSFKPLKVMTYIIAGNFNDTNFLMVDTIASNNDNEQIFNEKMFSVNSSKNTYLTLTGSAQLLDLISLYDGWKLDNGEIVDYNNATEIEEFLNIIEFTENNRLYIINDTALFYYDIQINQKNGINILSNFNKVNIQKNSYILCNRTVFDAIPSNVSDLYNFGASIIEQYNKYMVNDNSLNILHDFKNRFNYIDSNNFVIKRPYKNFNDLIETIYSKKYINISKL